VAPIHEGAFRVFKVYDETRQPADWSSLVGATQCAVFLKNVKTANPLATDGREIDRLMSQQVRLDFFCVDFLAAPIDQILDAAFDDEIAIRQNLRDDRGDVPG